ncbi:hypothetical protein [Dactylosporangium sp. CA-139066]|uniref:hypothetical protein n=1 Tax=Dactylosporangium sp. CA-139066 TaxID=3239930 RepID=UPI003D92FD02
MDIDLDAAVAFMTTHARVLDRRRLQFALGHATADDVLAALDAYRNPDGGYGWGLEPDLRSTTSQPVGAMCALEVLADLPDTTSRRPIELLDWLAAHTFAGGGVPFALGFPDTEGSAPHWVGADPAVPTLQMTAQLAAQAHRLARHRADVAEHPWLAAATGYCLDEIERTEEAPHAYVLMFAMHFLDAAAARVPRAGQLLEHLSRFVVRDGPTPVAGGAEGEVLHPLSFAPHADGPARAMFDAATVRAELSRTAAGQREDGGWTVDFTAFSPAAAIEWRGFATLQALAALRGASL